MKINKDEIQTDFYDEFTYYFDEEVKEFENLKTNLIYKFNNSKHEDFKLYPKLNNDTINTKIKDIFSKKISGINPWDRMIHYNSWNDTENDIKHKNKKFSKLNIEVCNKETKTFKSYNLKDFFNRKWITFKDNYVWDLTCSIASSQRDSVSIKDVVTVIDGKIIYIESFYFSADYNDKISEIECYSIYMI